MHTVTRPPVIPADPPPATPYSRRLAAERAVEEILAWWPGARAA